MARIVISCLLSIALLSSCSRHNKTLEAKVQTLELHYIAWACPCANWTTAADMAKYQDDLDKMAERSIFVEAADPTVQLPDTLGVSLDIVQFTGQFYKEKGYAKDYHGTDGKAEPARVFRYTSFKVVKSNYTELMNGEH